MLVCRAWEGSRTVGGWVELFSGSLSGTPYLRISPLYPCRISISPLKVREEQELLLHASFLFSILAPPPALTFLRSVVIEFSHRRGASCTSVCLVVCCEKVPDCRSGTYSMPGQILGCIGGYADRSQPDFPESMGVDNGGR